MSHPLVVHLNRTPCDVICDRSSKWGNQFRMGGLWDRQKVIAKHKRYLLTHPKLVDECRAELKGKVLGCWCAPKDCHCDTLAAVANSVPVAHEMWHKCNDDHCQLCMGWLYACDHCGGFEGGLSSECPRRPLVGDEMDRIYKGGLNFIAGEWVDAAFKHGPIFCSRCKGYTSHLEIEQFRGGDGESCPRCLTLSRALASSGIENASEKSQARLLRDMPYWCGTVHTRRLEEKPLPDDEGHAEAVRS